MAARSRKGARSSLVPTLLLTALTGGLGYAAYEAQQMPIDTSPIAMAAASASEPGKSAGAPLAESPAAPPAFAQTVARPLFNPARRPIVAQKPKVVEAPPPPPVQPLKAELVGLAATTANGGRALLKTASDRPAAWLSVGEEVGGWRLSEIRPDRVVFQSGEQKQELHLFPVRGKVRRIQ